MAYDGTYLSGEHNGGVYNSRNLNPYVYCYQNPVILIDPDGKQIVSRIIGYLNGLLYPVQESSILQFNNNRGNKVNFIKVSQGSSLVIANKSDADIDGDGSNSAAAKSDKTHLNTNAAGVNPDDINGYILPTSSYKAVKGGKVVRDKVAGIINRKAFRDNDVRHKDVGLLYNLKNGKSAYGIYLEGGPNNKSGEITPAAATELGIDPDPNTGGMESNNLLYMIFPGSSKYLGRNITQDKINKVGDAYYQQNKEIIDHTIKIAKQTPTIKRYD
jgi:hypothetical protein